MRTTKQIYHVNTRQNTACGELRA